MINGSTRIFASMLGAVGGAGGIIHGAYEALQGSRPPDDILTRIGAFTIIHDYLATGICAMIAGAAMIAWSMAFIHKPHGPFVFLLLALALFLVGGGVALVPGSLLVWGVATRIRKPLAWWGMVLSMGTRHVLAKLWFPCLSFGMLLFLAGFGLWSFALPPGEQREVTSMHYLLWTFLGSGALLLLISAVCGFARDLARRHAALEASH